MPSETEKPKTANLSALLVLSLEAMVHMKNSADTPEDEYRLQILKETLKQIKGE